MAAATAKKSGPFRDALLTRAARNHLARELRSTLGYNFGDSREAANELTDERIEDMAEHVYVASGKQVPVKAPSGGFLQFILDFLSSDQFKQLIALLLSLFGGPTQQVAFAVAPTEAPAQG